MNSISKSYSGFSITFQLSFKSRQQRTTYLTSFLPTLTYSFQRVWPKSGFGHDMFPHILTENGLIPKQQFHRRLIKPVMKIILISAWFTFVVISQLSLKLRNSAKLPRSAVEHAPKNQNKLNILTSFSQIHNICRILGGFQSISFPQKSKCEKKSTISRNVNNNKSIFLRTTQISRKIYEMRFP